MISAGLGWLAGTGWQLQAATLSPRLALWLGAAALSLSIVLAVGGQRWRRSPWEVCLVGLLAAVLGWGFTTWRAAERLDDRLAAALEGVPLAVEGTVRGLPQQGSDAVRFDFEPDRGDLPTRLRLSWYRPGRDGAGELPSVRPGERWRLSLRLKQVHGLSNPGGFDSELGLFEQGIGATGSVGSGHRLQASQGEWVARARDAVRRGIRARVADPSAAGLLAALSIGDQAAIQRTDWAVFRATGVAHLVAISGMHVTMFAWLAGGLIGRLWRRLGQAPLWCPAPTVARWGGVAAAALYALLAGWGVPSQRTVWMLVVAALLQGAGVRWPWPLVLGFAGAAVVLIDPWALLQPGFWLSFVAVAVLMAGGSAAEEPAQGGEGTRAPWWRQALETQLLVTAALAPLGLLFFQQVSIVGLLANLWAIPLVSFVLTPLALGGVLWGGLWSLAAWLVTPALSALATMAGWPFAAWQAPLAPAALWGLALLGMATAAMPWPRRLRCLGAVAMVPVFVHVPARPAEGHFELLGADIGQGNAVLLRTAHHDVLYDTGPRWGAGSDAGERVLVPLLRAQGVGRLDLLVLSHRDSDHVGGAEAVLRTVGAARVTSSLETGHPLRALAPHQPCVAGQRWQWDGVDFALLHPAEAAPGGPSNARSCVLRVTGRGGTALLAGDIEALQELRLAERFGAALSADVLLVPHHGSKTSSTPVFLQNVHPKWALVQAGYRNRFHHPAVSVVERYEAQGVRLVRTDSCGAWHWSSADGMSWCNRALAPRYWHAPVSNTSSGDDAPPLDAVWP